MYDKCSRNIECGSLADRVFAKQKKALKKRPLGIIFPEEMPSEIPIIQGKFLYLLCTCGTAINIDTSIVNTSKSYTCPCCNKDYDVKSSSRQKYDEEIDSRATTKKKKKIKKKEEAISLQIDIGLKNNHDSKLNITCAFECNCGAVYLLKTNCDAYRSSHFVCQKCKLNHSVEISSIFD